MPGEEAIFIKGGNRRNALWTNAEDQKLQTMFNHGISDTIIANSLGRTESSIRSRRFILGLSRK